MMRIFIKHSLFMLLIISCSTYKNTFVNRLFHSTTAYYNIIFNGNEALEKGRKKQLINFKDNFHQILPVELTEGYNNLPDNNILENSHFLLAKEKAYKAIRKHSMQIRNREYNYRILDAYLLLGKSKYHIKDYLGALEAFNYIIYKYPITKKNYEAQIWREKCNLRLENNNSAIFNYRVLLRQETFMTNAYKKEAFAMLAQAYYNNNEIDSSKTYLKKVIDLEKNKKIKGRYYFILSQLYEKEQQYDSMLNALNTITSYKRRTKKDYYIHAMLKKVEYSYLIPDFDPFKAIKKLQKQSLKNDPFLPVIYYSLGNYYATIDSLDKSAESYKKGLSINTNSPDYFLYGKLHEKLGDLFLNNNNQYEASLHYDSSLLFFDKNSSEYIETTVKNYFLKKIVFLEDELKKLSPHKETIKKENLSTSLNKKQKSIENTNKNTYAFYFYNNKEFLKKEKEQFQFLWDRNLSDNWRYEKNKIKNTSDTNVIKEDTLETILKEKELKITLNSKKTAIDTPSLINRYHFNLGQLYYDNFNNIPLAIKNFEAILESSRLNKPLFEAPTNYYLYEIYKQKKDTVLASYHKNIVLEYHPHTKYARYINSNIHKKSSIETKKEYYSVYLEYERKNYKQCISKCDYFIQKHFLHDKIPKALFLKAICSKKLNDDKTFNTIMNDLIKKYPESIQADKAKKLLSTILEKKNDLN